MPPPEFRPPLLQLRTRTWPPAGFLWFLAGAVTTLLVLAAVGVLP